MRAQRSRKISICIIPNGRSQVRTLHIHPWIIPSLLVGLLALVTVLGIYSYRSYNTIKSHVDYSSEVEALNFTKASLEAQLDIFADRVETLDRQLVDIKNYDVEVAALKNDVSRHLGLAPETPLEELLPYLRATVSWVDNENGVGGSEQLASSLSAAVAGSSRDIIRGMHRDLDRMLMEADNSGHYLLTVREGLSGVGSVLAATPMFLPVNGRISAKFGHRRSPFGGRAIELHRGLDIPSPVGTVVKAPADGTVLSVGQSGGYGLLLTIDHGFGLVTRYAHLSDTLVEAGAKVTRGQYIARTGNSGRSTGPHLHYETIMGGVAIDPLKMLPPSVASSAVFGPTAEALD